MILSGNFTTINDDNVYRVTIGNSGTSVTITDPIEYNYASPPSTGVMFSPDPVEISCDRQDLIKRIIISTATIRIMSDSNLTEHLFADTNRTIPVTISRSLNPPTNTSWESVFFGYVDPLQFDQGYAHKWESIQISATDPLGALQDLTIGKVKNRNNSSDAYIVSGKKSAWDIIYDCLNAIGIAESSVSYNITSRVNALMTNSRIMLSGFFANDATDEDSWMTLYEVLEEICKYFNLYISYYGGQAHINCTIRATGDQGPQGVTINGFQGIASNTSTSISVDDVYSQVNVTCEMEAQDELISSITDDVESVNPNRFGTYDKYMTEYVATGEGTSAYSGFWQLLVTDTTDYKRDDKSYGYARDNYVWVKKNDAWSFAPAGQQSYQSLDTNDQADYLRWLKNNPGKGALVAFGQADKRNSRNDPRDNNVNMKDYLVISICGTYDNWTANNPGRGADTMSNRFNPNNDPDKWICKYVGLTSTILSPPTNDVTNYIVITGNIILNPLYPLTGPHPANNPSIPEWGWQPWNVDILSSRNKEDQDACRRAKLTNTFEECRGTTSYCPAPNKTATGWWKHTVPSPDNDDGQYYQQKWVVLDPNGPQGIQAYGIYGDLNNTKNKFLEYKYNQYGENDNNVVKTKKLPILACELSIGDGADKKYCVERLDQGEQGIGLYEWKTEEQCNSLGIPKTFTIGIEPKYNEYLIGADYSIADNTANFKNIKANGTAIPVTYENALSGTVEFKILGPYNTIYTDYTRTKASFWNHSHVVESSYVLLQNVQSILISDFKINVKSDNGLISLDAVKADKDLVYASNFNQKYTDKLEESVMICTGITPEQAASCNVPFNIGNSFILQDEIVDDHHEEHIFMGWQSGSNVIRPEECLVDYYFIEYCTPAADIPNTSSSRSTPLPARIINTQMKSASLPGGLGGHKLTAAMMGDYFDIRYAQASGVYRIMKYVTSLKNKKTDVVFREYRTYNHTQLP